MRVVWEVVRFDERERERGRERIINKGDNRVERDHLLGDMDDA